MGLYIAPGIWRTLNNFSSGSVALSIASHDYNPEDYIYDYNCSNGTTTECKYRTEYK
jgi:hypothetical protein